MEFKDYYAVMGVAPDATQDEIKRAYRQLARKYHPDVSKEPDAEQRFKALGEAYAVLKDLDKRAAYDQLGSDWQPGPDFQPPHGRRGDAAFSNDEFNDLFESIYGRGPSQGREEGAGFHARGQDHHAQVFIDLEDAYTGATRSISVQTPEVDERGRVHLRRHTLKVTIPKGVRAGQHIRLVGQGMPGMGQGPAGDLYLEVAFNPHPHYRVDQRDVYFDLRIAPWEAALGTQVEVPTPGGRVALSVPADARAGRKLRLKGRGIPGPVAGDFYAVLQIVVPPADSEASRAFYTGMAGQFAAFDPRSTAGA